MALSYASPTDPIEGRTPAALQRRPKSIDVYWQALIRMVNYCVWLAPPQRHIQRVENELCAKVGCHRPTHDTSAPCIKHHRDEQEAGPGGHERYVRYPELIWSRCGEVALDQIRGGSRISVTPCIATQLAQPRNADWVAILYLATNKKNEVSVNVPEPLKQATRMALVLPNRSAVVHVTPPATPVLRLST